MRSRCNLKIDQLLKKGVKIPCPNSIEVGEEIDIDCISGIGVIIHSGCKIYGATTCIGHHTRLGYEAPVTLEDCQIGPDVDLKGGFFKKSVFLQKSNMGPGAYVREGTILEEEANGAHTVGLKQTILFPFVTLGSLINFCDCFMSGGTSRKDHSEVGSSYIHFNFTPNQDKATPSLIGDVPKGVMLDQEPIFLGGQGGMVGPCRLAFGTVVAAGTILRKDEMRSGRLLADNTGKQINMAFVKGQYHRPGRIVENNLIYIANLMALRIWYGRVRSQFISENFSKNLYEGLKTNLNSIVFERRARLKKFCLNNSEKNISPKWSEMEDIFHMLKNYEGDMEKRDTFLRHIEHGIAASGKDYIKVIKGLPRAVSKSGTFWLQSLVDGIIHQLQNRIPEIKNGQGGR